ncbi:MAG: peroxidase-related enzyme [Spirochaetia bacterium]
MARIEMVQPENATGDLAKVYEELVESRGRIAEVHKIQSLHPQSIRDHMRLYLTVMFARSPLSRAEREMIAVVVSAGNGCAYCVRHHGEALNHFWKDWSRIEELSARQAAATGLTERERALCVYAQAVAQDPAGPGTETAMNDLRALRLDDRAILDATLVVSYFSFVNRMVLALGVDLEEDAGGYLYE